MKRGLVALAAVLLAAWSQAAPPHELTSADGRWQLRADGAALTVFDAQGNPLRSHPAPAVSALLDAAARLRGVALHFVLVGDGHEKARLARRVADEGLDNVTLLPPLPRAQIPSLLGAMDIAYIGWQRVPIYRFGIAPNKLMDYMMAGMPVLHSVDAGNDPVADAGCGLTVPPEAPDAVAAGLRQLAALGAHERRAMGVRGRQYVRAHHSYAVLAQRFIEALV